MAHIIVTGATGSAGAAVLAYALSSPAISRISVLSRRPVKLAEGNPKANVIIHNDFEQYPSELLEQLKDARGCVWAQGISALGMQEEEYTKITYNYPVAAAKAFAGGSSDQPFNFVYISGEGARNDGKGQLFAHVKGRAENELLRISNISVYNVRPAIINPRGKFLAERKPTLYDRAASLMGGIASVVYKSQEMPTDGLAKACVDLAIGNGEPLPAGQGIEADGRLLRNTALRRLAGL